MTSADFIASNNEKRAETPFERYLATLPAMKAGKVRSHNRPRGPPCAGGNPEFQTISTRGRTMTTPTELYLRRLALGMDREAVSALSGLTVENIRKNERPTARMVYPSHVKAIEELEAWDSGELAARLVTGIYTAAEACTLDGRPVVWIYGDDAFAEFCPTEQQEAALGIPALHRRTSAEAFATLASDEYNPIAAEIMPDRYRAFLALYNLTDEHSSRSAWLRSIIGGYRTIEEE